MQYVKVVFPENYLFGTNGKILFGTKIIVMIFGRSVSQHFRKHVKRTPPNHENHEEL